MHNLILDKVKFNDNIEDHFEDLQKRHHNIFEDSETTNENGFGNDNNEKTIEKKSNVLDKKLVKLYRLHSSKFHKKRDTKSKEDMLNLLLNINKISEIKKIGSKNYLSKLRRKMAFKYRFMNKSRNKSISLEKEKKMNYKKKDARMIKILKISKSIPDVLYNQIKEMKKDKDNINNNENTKQINPNEFKYSLKLNRYTGNIYDYYKSEIPFYLKSNFFENNLIANVNMNTKNQLNTFKTEDKYISDSKRKIKLYKDKKELKKKENSNRNYKKIKINKVIIGNKKTENYIKLNSLLF